LRLSVETDARARAELVIAYSRDCDVRDAKMSAATAVVSALESVA
jgi:hypothetical protein